MEIIENFVVFVFIFLFCFSIIFSNSIGDLDELWNYNFARNVAEGLIPYKDFNMIVTPLLSIICAIILKITFNELISTSDHILINTGCIAGILSKGNGEW